MPRIYWKNSEKKAVEDEFVHMAIEKYGINQLPRILCLFPSRSEQGHRIRWKKWSLTEDSLLVHMVRLIPNQWNRIAATVGRSISECMDHYNELINDALRDDGVEEPEEEVSLDDLVVAMEDGSQEEIKRARLLEHARRRYLRSEGKRRSEMTNRIATLQAQTLASINSINSRDPEEPLPGGNNEFNWGGNLNEPRQVEDDLENLFRARIEEKAVKILFASGYEKLRMIKQNNMVLMKALEVLQDICDIYSYYVPMSLSALHEREKMDKLKDYSEESGREIFFLRQSLNDLRSSAKMLTVVTRDLFAKITQQVSEAHKDINNKHQSAITELWRLNNSAAELNQQNKQKLKTYEEEIKKAETTKEDIKHIKHLVANLSLSRLKLHNMVKEYTDELSSTTQVELAKLYRYLDAYNHSLCKTVFTPPEPNRVRIADVKRELQMQDVILLEEE